MLGAIQVIQLKRRTAVKREFGIQNQTNISAKHDHEEPVSVDRPTVDVLALLLREDECSVQCKGGKDLWPDGFDGEYDESTEETGETETEELDGESKQDLVAEGDPSLTEILWKHLYEIDVVCPSGVVGDGEHDGGKHLFFE